MIPVVTTPIERAKAIFRFSVVFMAGFSVRQWSVRRLGSARHRHGQWPVSA